MFNTTETIIVGLSFFKWHNNRNKQLTIFCTLHVIAKNIDCV